MYIFIYCHTSHMVKKDQNAGCFIGPPGLQEGENPLFWILLSFDCTVSLNLKRLQKIRTVSQYIRTSRRLVSIPQGITSSTLLWDPYSLGVSRIVAQATSIRHIQKYPWTLPLSNLPKFPTPDMSPLLLPSPVLRVHPHLATREELVIQEGCQGFEGVMSRLPTDRFAQGTCL